MRATTAVGGAMVLVATLVGCGSTNAPGSGQSSGSATGTPAKGITKDTVTVGVDYVPNDAANVDAANRGDAKKIVDALVADINAKGGLAGRKVEVVYHPYPATSKQSTAQLEQAGCAAFTQDKQVFAVVTGEQHTENFFTCLAKTSTPAIADRLIIGDDQNLKQNPALFAPTSVSLTRLAKVYVKGLVDKGFISSSNKVALVRENGAAFTRAADEALKPALAAAGITLVADVAAIAPVSDADTQQAAATLQAALPKFVSQGVDRVLFLDNGGYLPFLFTQGAAGAKYTPKYALTTFSGGSVLASVLPKALAQNQLAGSVLVGFNPTIDLLPPDWPKNPRFDECLKIVNAAGVKLPSPNAQSNAAAYCEQFDLLGQGLKNAGDTVTVESFTAGIEKLGTSFRSSLALGTTFGPGRHDGADSFKSAEFVPDCACYRYSGDVTP